MLESKLGKVRVVVVAVETEGVLQCKDFFDLCRELFELKFYRKFKILRKCILFNFVK